MRLITILGFAFFSCSAHSAIVNKLDGYDRQETHIVNDHNQETVSVVTFNAPLNLGCGVVEKMLKIEEITYEDDRYPSKIRFSNISLRRISIPTNFGSLSNAARSWTDTLFSVGDWVLVQYSTCGSGGYVDEMFSIKKHTKHFSKGGVDIHY